MKLEIKIPRRLELDYIILVLTFLHVMIFKFFNLNRYSNLLLICLILIKFLVSISQSKNKTVLMYIGFVFLVFTCALISYVNGRAAHIGVFKVNIQTLIYAMILASYFANMMKTKAEFIESFLSTWVGVLNVYYVFNMLLMVVQVINPGFMSGIATAAENTYAPDLVTGLFGYSSSHNLTFFTIFIILLNVYEMKKSNSTTIQHYYRIFLIVLLIYTLIISLFNDNKTLYFLLIAFIAVYIDITRKWIKVDQKFAKRLILSICIIVVGICLYAYIMTSDSSVVKPFREVIQTILDSLSVTQRNNQIVSGGSERIFLISYAFKYYNAFGSGYGLGAYGWDESTALGFYHFGLCDLGTYLVLGGLVLTIPLFLFYWYAYGKICFAEKDKYLPGKMEILALILIVAFYSTTFRDTTLQACELLCYVCIGLSARHRKVQQDRFGY